VPTLFPSELMLCNMSIHTPADPATQNARLNTLQLQNYKISIWSDYCHSNCMLYLLMESKELFFEGMGLILSFHSVIQIFSFISLIL
jgi:hypothetical protein